MACPRCGYDQSGVVASWQGQCPIEGVCSECGLRFEWRDVLNPSRLQLPWLYEHQPWHALLRTPRTMLHAIRPWAFWQEVCLHHRAVRVRLLMYPLMLPLFFVVVSILAVCAAQGMTHPQGFRWRYYSGSLPYLKITLDQFGMSYSPYTGFEFGEPVGRPFYVVIAAFGFSVGMALVILIAKSSRMISKMRAVHVARAVSYGMTVGILISALHSLLWLWVSFGRITSPRGRYSVPRHATSLDQIRDGLWGWMHNDWQILTIALGWSALWWWYALNEGFRLAMARQVFLAGVCIGLLLAGICVVFLGEWDWFYS